MWQPRAGDHVPAMSAPRAFALTVKDAGTGACTVLRVAPTTTAAALKQRLHQVPRLKSNLRQVIKSHLLETRSNLLFNSSKEKQEASPN